MSLREIAAEIRSLLSWLEGNWKSTSPVAQALAMMRKCFATGGTLFVAGNGGSASECAHLAAELSGINFRCINLSADQAVLTALANDISYEEVFAHQLATLGKTGDLLLALSTSGKSKNILRALNMAEACGIERIALTGNLGNPASTLAECSIVVPMNRTQRIQELHLMIIHYWYEELKEARLMECDCGKRGIM